MNTENVNEFEEMLSVHSYSLTILRRGEIRNAIILEVKEHEIIVDLNGNQVGIVRPEDLERLDKQYRDSLKVGDNVTVYVFNQRDQNDNLIVSLDMGLQQDSWEKARELLTSEDVNTTVLVTGYNRSGILVSWRQLEGFIPSSHLTSVNLSSDRRDAWSDLIGKELVVKVIEVNQARRRLIFSERMTQKEWRAQQKARLLAELKEGDVVEGTVTGLRDFGAFVNLGGADGLIHISELAWYRVHHPRDVLSVGDKIDVYVLNLDRSSNSIALSRKRLLRDPWQDAAERYHEGQLVEGTVTKVVNFGAFVALNDGLEGLLRLSEMGDGTLKEPYSSVQKGDRLNLRISRLEPEKRSINFTQQSDFDFVEINRWISNSPKEALKYILDQRYSVINSDKFYLRFPEIPLTVENLATQIAPFLQAFFGLQKTIASVIDKKSASEPRILAILSGSSEFQLTDVGEAVTALDKVLTPAQRKNRKELDEQHAEQARLITRQKELQNEVDELNAETLKNHYKITSDPEILEAQKQAELAELEARRQEAMLRVIDQRTKIAEKLMALQERRIAIAMQLAKETIVLYGIEPTPAIISEFTNKYIEILKAPALPLLDWSTDKK